MVTQEANVLWERSIETYNIRYRWMVSDGDSKAYSSFQDVYGEVKVEKLDCAGHVQKRKGKHLLNLRSTTKGNLANGKALEGEDVRQNKKFYIICRFEKGETRPWFKHLFIIQAKYPILADLSLFLFCRNHSSV